MRNARLEICDLSQRRQVTDRLLLLSTTAYLGTLPKRKEMIDLKIQKTELFHIYYKNVQMYVIRWNEYYFMKKGK